MNSGRKSERASGRNGRQVRGRLASVVAAAALLATACLPASAFAQRTARVDFGKAEFEARCASCHGKSGKGNGPLVEFLRRSPPDLTLLARNNGGILPLDRLYQSVTGDGVAAHGPRDMPVWGQAYREIAADHYMELPYDPDAYVRVRVLSVLEYINRLQQR